MTRSASPQLAPGRGGTRDRLLDAADALMWERGYEAVGVAELCAAAGAPRGSFYHWWPSKQVLALAMLERSWQRVRSTLVEPAFSGPGTLGERVDRYAEALAANLERWRGGGGGVPGCRFGNFAAELSTRDPAIRAAIERTFADMCAIFEAAIVEARAAGEVADDVEPAEAAEALCALMEGLMILAKARHDPAVVRQLGPQARRLLSMLPPPTSPASRRSRGRDRRSASHS